ncbi:MAG: hypothetical protein ACE5EL_05875, partial [Anaerolineae bacterium]
MQSHRIILAVIAGASLAIGAAVGLGRGAHGGSRAALAAGSEPDGIFTTEAGKFVFDPDWQSKPSSQCNVLGELLDCAGNTVVKIGTDQPDWTGWTTLDGKWIRVFGELTLLPSECGVHLYVADPANNVRTIDDPCVGLPNTPSPNDPKQPTATPVSGGGGGGGTIHVCTGSTVTSIFNVRAGSDDVVWSRQQGLKRTGAVLPFGGSQILKTFVGLRYQGVTVPRNAKIFSARVRVSPAANSGIDSDQLTHGVFMGNLPAWGAVHPGNAPRTPSSTVWQIRNQWTGSPQGTCNFLSTSNLANPVQDVVDRFDWTSGNALGLTFEWTGPFAEASQRPTWSYEGGCPPQLRLTWCPAEIVVTNPTATPDGGAPGATATKPGTIVDPTPTETPPTKTPVVTATEGPGATATATATSPGTIIDPTATETPPNKTATAVATDTPPAAASSTPTPRATDTPTPAPGEPSKTPTSAPQASSTPTPGVSEPTATPGPNDPTPTP